MHLKDKKDGLICVQLWLCSLEVENYDFTVHRFLKCLVALLLLWICSVGSGTSIVRVITVLKFRSDIIHISEKLMSYPLVLISIIESGGRCVCVWGGGGGNRTFLSYGQIFS